MRYLYYSNGLKFSCDSEQTLTHVVVGQRDESADQKKFEELKDKPLSDLPPEQVVALQEFAFKSTHGWYALKPLTWCESEEVANSSAEKFKAEGRINVTVKRISPDDDPAFSIIIYA